MKTMTLRKSGTFLLAGVIFASLLAPVALAQEVEEVVVVGSRGEGRDPLESMVPVDVIGADEMQRVASLGGELGELLQALAPSFSFPRQSNSGSVDHIRPAQLRGLSPDQVLVLVNGKRQHTTSVVNLEAAIGLGSTAFDFNTIPLIAIERIEILRDGAGAQYGSDAIAGVINVVLKSGADGGSLIASYGAHRTDFKPTNEDITDGQTFAIAADYGLEVGGGSIRVGFDYRDRAQTKRGGIGELPFFEEQTPANLALNNVEVFAPGDGASEDVSVFYNASFGAGENEFYSFGRVNSRDAEGTGFFRWPDGFQGVPEIFPEGYRPITTGDSVDLSIAAGFRGTAGRTDWDVSVILGRNEYEFGVKDSVNPSFGAASATSFDLADFEFMQTSINADAVTRFDVASMAAPVTLAYGAEVRLEDYETGAGDPQSYEAGPLADSKNVGAEAGPGLSSDSTVDVDRTAFAVYGDVELPLTENFALGVAARFEDYDDFGNSTNGKLSGRYAFSDSFSIRATVSTSFRAPSLAQTGFQFSTQNFGAGGMLETFGHLPVDDPLAIANGAVALEEETSDNISAGFVYNVGQQLQLTVDYFRVDIDDRITLVAGSTDNVTFFANLVDTETDGVDIMARGSTAAGSGLFSWMVAYNTFDTEVQNPSVLGEQELNILETAPPEDKIILQGGWDTDGWGLLLRATRFGETVRDFDFGGGFPDPHKFDAVWSIDIEAEYNINDNWTVAIGADNIADEYTNLQSFDNSFFGHLPYDVLSGIGMNGAYWYARTQFDFD